MPVEYLRIVPGQGRGEYQKKRVAEPECPRRYRLVPAGVPNHFLDG
ncbi:MAG: hypothetical protein Q7V05_09415 [Methanoregula sp.]|nr:hypothetical protein [Methanoregula sp.]